MSVVVTPRARSTSGLPLFRLPQSKMYSLTDGAVCGGADHANAAVQIARNSFINMRTPFSLLLQPKRSCGIRLRHEVDLCLSKTLFSKRLKEGDKPIGVQWISGLP